MTITAAIRCNTAKAGDLVGGAAEAAGAKVYHVGDPSLSN
jgi:hypothetical protein